MPSNMLFVISALLLCADFAISDCPKKEAVEIEQNWLFSEQPKGGWYTPICERVNQAKLFAIKNGAMDSAEGPNQMCFEIEVFLDKTKVLPLKYNCEYEKLGKHQCGMDAGVIDPVMKKFPKKLLVTYIKQSPNYGIIVTCLSGAFDHYLVIAKTEKLSDADQKEVLAALGDRTEKDVPVSYRSGRINFSTKCNKGPFDAPAMPAFPEFPKFKKLEG